MPVQTYEATIVVAASKARTDYDKAVAAVRELYESEGAQFLEFEKWEENKLAYPIKGETAGVYFCAYFTADPEAVARIERKTQLTDAVLRQLIINRAGPSLERIKTQRKVQAERAAERAAEREAERERERERY